MPLTLWADGLPRQMVALSAMLSEYIFYEQQCFEFLSDNTPTSQVSHFLANTSQPYRLNVKGNRIFELLINTIKPCFIIFCGNLTMAFQISNFTNFIEGFFDCAKIKLLTKTPKFHTESYLFQVFGRINFCPVLNVLSRSFIDSISLSLE